MSANVGLSTPRGSGTSGYVQRNLSFLKPRDGTFTKPPVPYDSDNRGEFKQRQPDKQILEHEKRRAIEVQLVEERDRLEEENEALEEAEGDKGNDAAAKDGDDAKSEKSKRKVKLSEDEIEERITALREKLTRELEDEMAGGGGEGDPYARGKRKYRDSSQGGGHKGRKQFKTYQVHEQAEAKIEESERLRRALGIRRDGDEFAHEEVGRRSWDRRPRDWDRERERDRDDASYERSRYDDRESSYRR